MSLQLSKPEEIVLLSIWKLRNEAYGVAILRQASRVTGREWSIGAIYAPLHRLQKKGLVRTECGEPLPERGGRSRVYYDLTPKGKRALVEARRVYETLWAGVPTIPLESK
jgi:PadR family transcriptional regulator PadR